ncbi:MAG: response regulator [Candidatus Omnitrophota bacterium]|nr:response regulator [Candidatus Omnitrophota bacterium]
MPDIGRKEVYSSYDLCLIFGEEQSVIHSWILDGSLSAFQITGGHYRIYHEDVIRFMDRQGIGHPGHWRSAQEKYRVLIIDDEEDMLDILGSLLREDPRFEIRTTHDGRHGGLCIPSWHPDLIVLDMLMPGISGFEMCKQIRLNSKTEDIPVLALTSLSTPEGRDAVTAAGVSDYLVKNFHSETLMHKVRTLLGLEASKIKETR